MESLLLTNGESVTADFFIDGTGGGALCSACGCQVMQGQEARGRFNKPGAPGEPNERINGVTLIFRVSPARCAGIQKLPDDIPRECWWSGRFPVISAVQYPSGGYNCNILPTMEGAEFLRLGRAAAYRECRRRVAAQWHHLQSGWSDFRNFRMSWAAPALGLRETTRVVCEYVLTEHDLDRGLSGQAHDDIVTIADHAVNRHGAGGGAHQVDEPYGVPYRCLIPEGFSNMLIACRGAGFSSIAASSCRLSRTMMQLGQAAGTAAALAGRNNMTLPAVDLQALRASLKKQHVQLEFPLPDDLRDYVVDEL